MEIYLDSKCNTLGKKHKIISCNSIKNVIIFFNIFIIYRYFDVNIMVIFEENKVYLHYKGLSIHYKVLSVR
jgi:hypothetical protein